MPEGGTSDDNPFVGIAECVRNNQKHILVALKAISSVKDKQEQIVKALEENGIEVGEESE